MKDEWYGNKRDLVKWGVLLHLANLHKADRILQVAYFRPSSWSLLDIDDQPYPIPDAVIEHFRNIRNIRKLKNQFRIDVIMSHFSDRERYLQEILREIRASGEEKSVIFLDPDTGLEPRKPGLDHVLNSELAKIWAGMRDGDVLAFYQHQTNRNGTPWIEPKRKQFEHALGLVPGTAKCALGRKLAPDVVFFYCRKWAAEK